MKITDRAINLLKKIYSAKTTLAIKLKGFRQKKEYRGRKQYIPNQHIQKARKPIHCSFDATINGHSYKRDIGKLSLGKLKPKQIRLLKEKLLT